MNRTFRLCLVLLLGIAAVNCSSSPGPAPKDGGTDKPDTAVDKPATEAAGHEGGADADGATASDAPTDSTDGGPASDTPSGSDSSDADAPLGDASDVAEAQPGDASDVAEGPSARTTKIAFVSSVAYAPTLGGLAGADAKCQALADAANLGGTYKVWLSDATGSPSTRFTHPTVDYVLADLHTVLAHGWTELTMGHYINPLDLTEKAGPPPAASANNTCAAPGIGNGSVAWVSTNADGTPADGVANGLHTCSNWTSAVSDSSVGFGEPTGHGLWIGFCNTGTNVCTFTASIYCFEQ